MCESIGLFEQHLMVKITDQDDFEIDETIFHEYVVKQVKSSSDKFFLKVHYSIDIKNTPKIATPFVCFPCLVFSVNNNNLKNPKFFITVNRRIFFECQ